MKTIGRADQADFPELDLEDIKIKVDTGAFTSSIHCHEIKEVEIDGEKFIEFKLLDPSHPNYSSRVFKTKNYYKKAVKSSFGDVEKRFVIKTTIVVFEEEYAIDLSLSERGQMKFPVLLGRKFLNHKFIVNPVIKDTSYHLKIEKNKNS